MPQSRDGVAVELTNAPGGGDRPVAGTPLDLLVGAAGAGPDRHPDLGEHLGRPDDRLVRAGVELARRHRALAARASGSPSSRRSADDDGRQVLGRIGLAQRAADRCPRLRTIGSAITRSASAKMA